MTDLTYHQIMTTSRAAAVLSVHPETVRQRADSGELPHRRHGTMYVFDAAYIYALSGGDETQPEAEPDPPPMVEAKPLYPAVLTQPPFDTCKPKAAPASKPEPKTSRPSPVVEAAMQLVVEVSDPDEAPAPIEEQPQPVKVPFFGARFNGKVYRLVYVDGLGHITAVG